MTAPTAVTQNEVYLLGVVDNGEVTFDTVTRTYLWLDVPMDPDDAVTLTGLVADGYATTTAGENEPLQLTTRGEEAVR